MFFCHSVQDDANPKLAHTRTPAFLHSSKGEPGEGHPTQAPVSAGLWRKGLQI